MNNGIGVLIHYRNNTDIEAEFKKAIDMEITSCQLCMWDEAMYSDETAEKVKAAIAKTGFNVTAVRPPKNIVFLFKHNVVLYP